MSDEYFLQLDFAPHYILINDTGTEKVLGKNADKLLPYDFIDSIYLIAKGVPIDDYELCRDDVYKEYAVVNPFSRSDSYYTSHSYPVSSFDNFIRGYNQRGELFTNSSLVYYNILLKLPEAVIRGYRADDLSVVFVMRSGKNGKKQVLRLKQ